MLCDFDWVDVTQLTMCNKALELIPYSVAKFHSILPVSYEGEIVKVVVPEAFAAEGLLEHLTNLEVVYLKGNEEDLLQMIECFYRDKNLEKPLEMSTRKSVVVKDASTIEVWLDKLLTDACKQKASDVHIEPLEKGFQVRFRTDGELKLYLVHDFTFYASVLSRLKLLARLSIDQKRLPQDGRFQWVLNEHSYVIRISILPSIRGETVVLRILPETVQVEMANLGFTGPQQEQVKRLMQASHGLILVAGPTGSGKTTTLYSILRVLQRSSCKIITIEDPIEYQLMGISQMPVNLEWGTSFSAALRSILRQAPDIIMVGEIRDFETAEIAMNAALTGHLIFATVHASDAFSALYRLMDLGIEPSLLVSSVRAIIAQRLVRKNCKDCCQEYIPSSKEVEWLGLAEDQLLDALLKRGNGCGECGNSGFNGRTGLFEILEMDAALQSLIQQNQPIPNLITQAMKTHFVSMKTIGMQKVLEGLTTIDAVASSLLTVDEA